MKFVTNILFGSAALIATTNAMKLPAEEKATEESIRESITNRDYKDVDGFISDDIKAAQLPGLDRGCVRILGWAKVSPISPSYPDRTNVGKGDRKSLTHEVHNAIVTLNATSRYSLTLSWPKEHGIDLKWMTTHNTLHMERLRLVPGKLHGRYYLDVTKDQSLVYRLWFMNSAQQNAFHETWHNFLRQYYPGKANDQTRQELDELTDRYEELRRRNEETEELAKIADARRAPISPAAIAELKAPRFLSYDDLIRIFESQHHETKTKGNSFGLHIPQNKYMAVSEATITEIFKRRMVEFGQMKRPGKPKPHRYSYITNTFTCSDFARVFQACVAVEQHDLYKQKGEDIRFAFAEVWSEDHAYNAIVTKDEKILFFEPQCGQFLRADQIAEYADATVQFAKF